MPFAKVPHNTLTAHERAELVASVEGLCRKIARLAHEHWPAAGDVDDFAQVARIGALHAAELFDSARGFRFTTYATRWIRQACRRFGLGNGLIHTPEYLLRAGDPAAVVHQLDPDKPMEPPSTEPDPSDRLSRLEGTRAATIEVAWILTLVPDNRDREILRQRFGIGQPDGEELTLEDIGKRQGMTRERVRQIQKRCLDRLKKILAG